MKWKVLSPGQPSAAILALVATCAIFQAANSNFLTPLNLTNLLDQIAAAGTISVGVVLLLLIGEIDLSLGAVSGLCAAVSAVLASRYGAPGVVAIAVGLGVGAAIGLLQGIWVVKFQLPSLIVTLSGFLAWQGVELVVLGDTGTVNISDPSITALANQRLDVLWGWALGGGLLVVWVVSAVIDYRRRTAATLSRPSVAKLALRAAAIGCAVVVMVGLMGMNRSPSSTIQGVPSGVLAFAAALVSLDFVVRRTRFGRHLFAVGGNKEAAWRAGVRVDRVRIACFSLAAMLAAAGGLLAASRLYAVNQSSGAGDVLLIAIAAPVIGGTSLFGGRGSIWSALFGALVLGAVSNGMDLLAIGSSMKYVITGGVLLTAVTVDAVGRHNREAASPALAPSRAAERPAQPELGQTLLTPREREVAALIACGMTNRQIAATLVMSERTAGAHVEHILEKLGVRSRAQVAVWASQHEPQAGPPMQRAGDDPAAVRRRPPRQRMKSASIGNSPHTV